MPVQNVTVIGLQWGDEGKGKVVDSLARNCRYVVRFCGGANAGHSVNIAGERFAMHLMPCGIFHAGVINVIANGVVVDPAVLLGEIEELTRRGVPVGPANLRISLAAHVVMPYHRQADSLEEQSRGAGKIGTTTRGIGPCYSDKAGRFLAIRVGDLLDDSLLAEKVKRIIEVKNRTFSALYGSAAMDAGQVLAETREFGRKLAPMVCNTGALLRRAIADGERIMFEGGQGTMLDIDHGTYPFVTSSLVSACGVPGGAGVPPKAVGQVVGLVKAYTTRVGAGPFPTEQDNAIGSCIRERGREYGTTTGRPRRCGWLDAFAVRYAVELSGVDELALSLLDVLSGFDELKICTGYRRGGKAVELLDPARMDGVECVYETLPGWSGELDNCRSFGDLPAEARRYVDRIEHLLSRPVGIISVGPQRDQIIIHNTKVVGLS